MACSAGARKEFSRCWPVSLTRSVSAIGSCSTSWIVWSKRRSESCGERLISMYELLGICLVLAALLTINAFASLAAAAAWRLLERPTRNFSARARAEILFVIRISPAALAVVSVAAFLVPSFLAYEPYATTEVVSKKLAGLAIVSAVGVGFALWRGVRSWWATKTLLRKWLATAEQIRLSRVDIPTFRIRHPFPIIAVVGTLRPRLFIAEHVLQTLSDEELI